MSFPIPNRPPTRFAIPPRAPSPKPDAIIHVQENLVGADFAEKEHQSAYTSKIVAPIYEPKGFKPHVFELIDRTKARRLSDKIVASSVSEEEKVFLLSAAARHYVFNYKKIADYYANASEEMQALMEDSALVIIDFEDAIAKGFVKFSEEIAKIYAKEHGKTE